MTVRYLNERRDELLCLHEVELYARTLSRSALFKGELSVGRLIQRIVAPAHRTATRIHGRMDYR